VAGVTLALFATGNIMVSKGPLIPSTSHPPYPSFSPQGFSSVTIPELLSSDSSIKATHDDLSWIGNT
jgi:hypothetical protein